MLSDHQRNASRLFLVLLWLQASFPGYIKYSLNLSTLVLLIVAPREKLMLEFVGPILRGLFL